MRIVCVGVAPAAPRTGASCFVVVVAGDVGARSRLLLAGTSAKRGRGRPEDAHSGQGFHPSRDGTHGAFDVRLPWRVAGPGYCWETHAHWANLFLLIAFRGRVFGPAARCGWWHLVPVGSLPRTRDRFEVLHELRGARRPRTRRLATGLCAIRAPISERPAVVSRNRRVPNLLLQQHGRTTMSVEQELQTRRAPARVTAGIDWASEDHAVAVSYTHLRAHETDS